DRRAPASRRRVRREPRAPRRPAGARDRCAVPSHASGAQSTPVGNVYEGEHRSGKEPTMRRLAIALFLLGLLFLGLRCGLGGGRRLEDRTTAPELPASALEVVADLDFPRYARGQPRILAFDPESRHLVHQYDFPSEVAGFLSMLNDFQVDPRDGKIYIADASPIRQKPALVVYDPATRSSRRVLEGD